VDWDRLYAGGYERDLHLFNGRAGQFVFISSASAYQKTASHYLITEETPLENPYWDYSRNKIACEQRLMRAHRENNFPVTIVRPSLTYGPSQIRCAWAAGSIPTPLIDRMKPRPADHHPGRWQHPCGC